MAENLMRNRESELIRAVRRELRMTQGELANAMDHCLGTIARWETNKPLPAALIEVSSFAEKNADKSQSGALVKLARELREIAVATQGEILNNIESGNRPTRLAVMRGRRMASVSYAARGNKLIQLLRIKEAAELINVKPKTIRNWVALGRIEKVTVGARGIRVRRSELEAMVGTLSKPAKDVDRLPRPPTVVNSQVGDACYAVARCAASIASSFAQLAKELQSLAEANGKERGPRARPREE